MTDPRRIILWLLAGLAVGLACNLHVLATLGAFGMPYPGFTAGAWVTAGFAAVFTGAIVLIHRLIRGRGIGLDDAGVPYLLGLIVGPWIAFGSVLAGLVAVLLSGVVILATRPCPSRKTGDA